MTTVADEPASLDAFLRGESALVYARWRENPNGEPYYLADGTAADPAVKALAPRLECLMDECDDRRLSVVNRHGGVVERRDGFRHRPGTGNHSPESLFHMQAKQMLDAWVRGLNLGVKVRTEGWSPTRERRADVMVTWIDDRQVAFEVQYSALGINEWLERHRSYEAQGIVDVWLFANVGTHFRRAPSGPEDPDAIFPSELHRTLAREGVPVFFINPVDRLVASTYVRNSVGITAFEVQPAPADEWTFVAIESIDDCSLDPALGLVTPRRTTSTAQMAAFLEAQRAAEEAEAVRLSARLKIEAEQGTAKRRQTLPRPKPVPRPEPKPWDRENGTLSPEQIADREHCARCGTKLPYWQRGGACPEFACWPHEPGCYFARPDLPVRAAADLLDPTHKPVGCRLCGGAAR